MSSAPQSFSDAVALHQAGRLGEAEALYRQVLEQKPQHAGALYQLGLILYQSGRAGQAIAFLERAAAAQPQNAAFANLLGMAWAADGRISDALRLYRHALQLQPNYPEALNNLANAQRRSGQLDEAIAGFGEAILQRPNFSDAYYNLGNTLKDAGRLGDAIDSYRRAVEINPRDAIADSARLYTMYFHPAYDAAAIFAEHRKWNDRYARPLMPPPAADANRSSGRRLRIGYVSPDFRAHPVGRLFFPLIAHHDATSFEIFCYSDVRRPDPTTQRIRQHAHTWRTTARLNDEQFAALVRQDQIDILIDLTLHMENHRLLAFARRPAPVQATYLAYCGTSGMDAMDYRLTDPYLDPPAQNGDPYSERSVHLPQTYWCYEAPDDAPPVNDLPAIPNRFVTFGCFNNYCKVAPPVIHAWGRILSRMAASKLVLFCPQGSHRTQIVEVMRRLGVAADRIEFVHRVPLAEYFDRHLKIDIALDPFPYTGGTTTLDALWMGIPVVSLSGQTAVARGGASILTNAGLAHLIAANVDQYVQIASALAADVSGLSAIRATLRERTKRSPLMNGPQFAKAVEAAYQKMEVGQI